MLSVSVPIFIPFASDLANFEEYILCRKLRNVVMFWLDWSYRMLPRTFQRQRAPFSLCASEGCDVMSMSVMRGDGDPEC